jgi:drug/metabolite transporter (DMT)-like permease
MSATRKAWIFLFFGIIAASQSGNLVRLGDASPFAITTWRLALASLMLAPIAGPRLVQLFRLGAVDFLFLVLAGVALALHFFTWIAGVQHTAVANASIFFSINPVITSMAGWIFFRERPTKRLAISIACGLGAVVVIGIADFDLNPGRAYGNALAVLSSLLFTVYFLLGKRVRRSVDSRAYVTGVYGIAALTGLATLLVLGLPVVEYSSRNWTCFLLMALIPTMIGHTSINHASPYIEAGRISAFMLMEPLTAGLGAAIFWGEGVQFHMVAGYALICVSVLILVLDPASRTRIPPPPEDAA